MCCDSLRKIIQLFYFPPFPFLLQEHDKTQSPPLDYYLDYVGCTFSHKNHSDLLSLNFIYIYTLIHIYTHLLMGVRNTNGFKMKIQDYDIQGEMRYTNLTKICDSTRG